VKSTRIYLRRARWFLLLLQPISWLFPPFSTTNLPFPRLWQPLRAYLPPPDWFFSSWCPFWGQSLKPPQMMQHPWSSTRFRPSFTCPWILGSPSKKSESPSSAACLPCATRQVFLKIRKHCILQLDPFSGPHVRFLGTCTWSRERTWWWICRGVRQGRPPYASP